jgi:hypothetical protein
MLLAALRYAFFCSLDMGSFYGAICLKDVVFLDEGLSTIITAIKVSRQIFHRMKGMDYTPAQVRDSYAFLDDSLRCVSYRTLLAP